MTQRLVISDSSTLILVVKAELVDVLVKTFRIFIPRVVFVECVERGKEKGRWDALKIEQLFEEKLVQIKDPSNKNLQKVSQKFNLHRGELHAIALALDMKAEFVLTDDLKAMNACRILSIKFVSAAALALTLFEKRKITQKTATECFSRLEEFGWYSPTVLLQFKQKLKEVKI